MTTIAGTAAPAIKTLKSVDFAHNLADLQAEARKRYRMTPEQTLEAAQSLRQHGLITNPCVDERRLPEADRRQLSRLVNSYGCITGNRATHIYRGGPGWFDMPIGGEHGITLSFTPYGALFGVKLSRNETRIYELIHTRLLQLFTSPAHDTVIRAR